MADLLTLPTIKDKAFQSFQTYLSGKIYRIDINWNSRLESWFLNLYDSDNNPLLLSKALRVNTNILATKSYDTRFPPGILGLDADAGDGSEADFGALSRTHWLRYVEI